MLLYFYNLYILRDSRIQLILAAQLQGSTELEFLLA